MRQGFVKKKILIALKKYNDFKKMQSLKTRKNADTFKSNMNWIACWESM